MCSLVLLFLVGVFASLFVPVTVLQEPLTVPNSYTDCEVVPLEQKLADARAYTGNVLDNWQIFVDSSDPAAIRISWTQDVNLVYMEYLDFDCDYTQEQIDNYFDFDIILSNYEGWERTAQCETDELTLHEFDVNSEGSAYKMRYWIDPVDNNLVADLFLTFPEEDVDLLDSYAEQLYPSLPSCVGS